VTDGAGFTIINIDNSLTPTENLDTCGLFVVGATVNSAAFVYAGQAPEDRWDAATLAGQTALSLSDRANADLTRVDSIMRFLHDIPLADLTVDAPNNSPSGQPVIVGTGVIGDVLSVDLTGISDDDGIEPGSYGYQWILDGIAISGASSDTYTPILGQEGSNIAVIVTFVDGNGVTEATQSDGLLLTL
jgi:hypothetical protein